VDDAREVEDGFGLAVKLLFLGSWDADVELEDEREGAGVRRTCSYPADEPGGC